jgi:pyruvate dehydrogenase E1 component beta subunit
MDQIVNSCAKLSYMSAGELTGGSIVFRGLNGPALSIAAQHTQCFASYYANIPGLITLCPYDAEDCKGLLKAAVRNPNPVMFLENETLYGEIFEVPEEVRKNDFIL